MSLTKKKPALILIDLQKGWEKTEHWGGNRNNPYAEKVAKELLDIWREKDLPVFHIIHSSTDPNSELHESKPGFQMLNEFQPIDGEPLIIKHVNSGFIGTDLKERLDTQDIDKLVIAGLTTNHCVSTTTRMAGNFGFEVYLVSDASATFDRKGLNGEVFEAELIHQTALASLNEEFATVLDKNALLEIL
ncbi:isochorismatase [Roseivirga sp. 4D4]|uniref:cysteine hydrolase family protein n=1 Tax=Roseivirga sp. 4D4 TaxID=1889784 RepID=UPI000853F047|nr:cysteine hydrolase family protein [Roseivirga sp. 4D4]OEK01705.1 isochorismatase [Roseivirga sp. 4D4]